MYDRDDILKSKSQLPMGIKGDGLIKFLIAKLFDLNTQSHLYFRIISYQSIAYLFEFTFKKDEGKKAERKLITSLFFRESKRRKFDFLTFES